MSMSNFAERMSCDCAFIAPRLPWLLRSSHVSRTSPLNGVSSVVCARKGRRGKSKKTQGSRRPSSQAGGQDELLSEFVEDVKDPLRPGKFNEPIIARREREAKNKEDMSLENLIKSGKALDFLQRATWFGVFALVAIFLATHLIVVRDWLPKGADPSAM